MHAGLAVSCAPPREAASAVLCGWLSTPVIGHDDDAAAMAARAIRGALTGWTAASTCPS